MAPHRIEMPGRVAVAEGAEEAHQIPGLDLLPPVVALVVVLGMEGADNVLEAGPVPHGNLSIQLLLGQRNRLKEGAPEGTRVGPHFQHHPLRLGERGLLLRAKGTCGRPSLLPGDPVHLTVLGRQGGELLQEGGREGFRLWLSRNFVLRYRSLKDINVVNLHRRGSPG